MGEFFITDFASTQHKTLKKRTVICHTRLQRSALSKVINGVVIRANPQGAYPLIGRCI